MRRQVRSLAAAFVLALASPASAISFDLSGGGDFGPTGTEEGELSATGGGLTLTVTASTLIPKAEPALDGEWGVVFINTLGVGPGSNEISGGGRTRDEALHFAWSMPVITSSVALTQFDLSDSKKKGKTSFKTKRKSKHYRKHGSKHYRKHKSSKKKGDAAFVYIDDPSQPLLTEAMVLLLLDPVIGEQDTYSLNLAAAPDLPSTLSSLSIRATNGHFLVSRITAVPEPATLALLGAGLVGMVWRRLSYAPTRSCRIRIPGDPQDPVVHPRRARCRGACTGRSVGL